MRSIKENKFANEISYTVTYYKDYISMKQIFQETISCKAVTQSKDNFDYLLVYSSNMKLDRDMFRFLNVTYNSKSINSRIKDMTALKLLLCFQEIIKKDILEFTLSDLNMFKAFLHGRNIKGIEMVFDLETVRSNSTVNGYLSVYRQFINSISPNSDISNLFNQESSTYIPPNDNDNSPKKKKYKINEKTAVYNEIPSYISVSEFIIIHKYCRDNDLIIEEIIIRLMFQCGLRIGEVLGLTNEDLVSQKYNNKFVKAAIIRNRVTDKNYQKAKTCFKVNTKDDYLQPDYNHQVIGWQMVQIPDDLFRLLENYIEEFHQSVYNQKQTQYNTYTLADQVDPNYFSEIGNFYIFINTQGRPLSQKIWNDRLRKIFSNCNIILDTKKRKHNLSHRFRHGFAMYNVQYRSKEVSRIQLSDLMRHTNINSIEKYYKPTISDKIKLKTDYIDNLYELVPELRFDYVKKNKF